MWDSSFTNGQDGCFLSEAQQLAIQQLCVQPRYVRPLGALQACIAQRRSCQCTDAASCAAVTAREGCQPLLGCWLARLQGQPYDLLQLMQVQMLRVGPLLATLTPNATAKGLSSSSARRRLLQPLVLNDPVSDDPTASKNKSGATEATAASPTPSAVAAQGAGGQNKPILSDPTDQNSNWVNPNSGSSSSGGSTKANMESAQLISAGIIQPEVTQPTLAVGGASSSDSDGIMTYAPPSFWKCLADAAVKSDRTTDWAGVDYNSKKLSLDTWLGVIRKLSLLDWGVQVLDCYKQQAAASQQGGVGAAPDNQSQESYEFAIVALIRAFGGMETQFQTYMQAGVGQAAAASAGMAALTGEILPEQIAALTQRYNSSPAYTGDSMLQARALLADVQWFVAEAAAAAEADGQEAAAFEGVIWYGVEQMRYLLRWLFAEQFGGPRAYVPPSPASVQEGFAAAQALSALAAAQLPAAGVPLSEPRWLQARAMGTHAMLAVALDARTLATGQAANATRAVASVVSAMAAAHVADFWAVRIEAARAASDPALRALALDDRSATRGARDAALGAAGALRGLRDQVAAITTSDEAAAAGAPAARMRDSMAQLLGSISMAANPDLPDTAAAEAVAAATRAAALAQDALACFGGGAAAQGAAHAAGCADLTAATAALVKASLSDLGAGDALYAAASDGVGLQWKCSARAGSSCSSLPGCVEARLPVALVIANSYPTVVPLPAPDDGAACQADDARLGLRRASNATKAALAASGACASFLQLPACESVSGGAASCEAYGACRWQAKGARRFVQGAAAAAAPAAADGVCGTDWQAVLQGVSSAQTRSVLARALTTCSEQKAADGCGGIMAEVAVSTTSSSRPGASPKVVAPVVVASAAVTLALAGAGFLIARRRRGGRGWRPQAQVCLQEARLEAQDQEGRAGGVQAGPHAGLVHRLPAQRPRAADRRRHRGGKHRFRRAGGV